jgi:hypothetical protein
MWNWVSVRLPFLTELCADRLQMAVGQFDEAALCLLVRKSFWGGQTLEEAAESSMWGFEGSELLEEVLGRPVAWKPDHVALDVGAQGTQVGPPHVELVLTEIPQAAQQSQKAVRILEVIAEVEFLGQLSPRTAGYFHVVDTEPHNVLQSHLLGS